MANNTKIMRTNLKSLLAIITRERDRNGARPFNIVLEGNIGSGKSTFLKYFDNNPQICIDSEPLNMWCNCNGHNLLALQYEDPIKWASTLQSYVQLTMLQLHMKQTPEPIHMMERSVYSARYCFIENMIRQGKMPSASAAVLDEWHQFITRAIPVNIDLIVYLQTSPEVVYKRMLKRERAEEAKVPIEYIRRLHDLHDDWLINQANTIPAPVLVIDGNVERYVFEEEIIKFTDGIRQETVREALAK